MVKYSAKFFKAHPDAVVPEMKSAEAAGYDLCCVDDFSLYPGEMRVVDTGLVIQPPPGYHFEVLVRSGLAYKHNIMLANNVGLIDRDYAGATDTVKLMLYRAPQYCLRDDIDGNPFLGLESTGPIEFKKGDRVAQLVFRETHRFSFEELPTAPADAKRGGLGSTGV